MNLAEVQLDEFLRRLQLLVVGGTEMPILNLLSDPTTTPTLANLGQLGVFAGDLYVHLTDANDTAWLDLTELRAGPSTIGPPTPYVRRIKVTEDPTVNPPVDDYPVGTIAEMEGGTPGTLVWVKTYPGTDVGNPNHWMQVSDQAAGGVYNILQRIAKLGGEDLFNTIVLTKTVTYGFADFAALGHVSTGYIDFPEVMPVDAGFIFCASKVRDGGTFAGSGITTVVLDVGATGYPKLMVDGFDVANPGHLENNGLDAMDTGVPGIIRVTLTVDGYLDDLVAGAVDVTFFYRMP